MPRGRKPKYPPELTFQQYMLLRAPVGSSESRQANQSVQEALNRPFEVSPTWNHRLVRDVGMDELDLPSRARTALGALGITKVGKLMSIRRTDLLAQRRLGQVSLDRLRQEIIELLWPPLVGDGSLKHFHSFDEIVESFVRSTIPQVRKADLALGRLAPTANRPKPLKDFGDQHGLSRERIRQIVDEAYLRLTKPAKLAMLLPLWQEVWAILRSWSRPVPLHRLAEGLRRRLNWSDAPPGAALVRLFAFHPELVTIGDTVMLDPMNP